MEQLHSRSITATVFSVLNRTLETTVMIYKLVLPPWSNELQNKTPRFKVEDLDGHRNMQQKSKTSTSNVDSAKQMRLITVDFRMVEGTLSCQCFLQNGSITYCFFFGISLVFNQEKRGDEATKIGFVFCNSYNISKRGRHGRRIDTHESQRWAIFIILFQLNLNTLLRYA